MTRGKDLGIRTKPISVQSGDQEDRRLGNFPSKFPRSARAVLVCLTGSILLSGCGTVAGFFGIEFETFYSAEQREVFRTNVQLGLSNLSRDAPRLTPQELFELDESGIVICKNLNNFSRDQVKQRFIRELMERAPLANENTAGRVAEVFIQASTAQGSLCSELR